MKALQFDVNPVQFALAKAVKPVFGNRVFFRGPLKTTKLVDIAEPELPGEHWVKIQTVYCGFCGSDLNLIRLHDSPTASPFTSFPCVLGHEIVGRIVDRGGAVRGFEPGDTVTVNPALGCAARGIESECPGCTAGRPANCENLAEGDLAPGMFIGITRDVNGGFARYLVAHESQLFKVPSELPLEAAAMTEPTAVALQTMFDNRPAPEDRILVIGGGVIGNLLIQSARTLAPGCRIAVIEPSARAAELALKMGAREVISWKEIFDQTTKSTGSTAYKPMIGREILMGGFDRIYDTVANSKTLNMALRVLAAFGTLSVVGIGRPVTLDLTPLWLKLQTIQGVYGCGRVSHEGKRRHVFDVALEWMSSGRIDTARLVTHKFRLADYMKMIEVNLDKGRHNAVKTLVAFD